MTNILFSVENLFPPSLCVPLAVDGFYSETRLSQLLQCSSLTIILGQRRGSTSLFQVLKVHSGLPLQTAQLLDQAGKAEVKLQILTCQIMVVSILSMCGTGWSSDQFKLLQNTNTSRTEKVRKDHGLLFNQGCTFKMPKKGRTALPQSSFSGNFLHIKSNNNNNL